MSDWDRCVQAVASNSSFPRSGLHFHNKCQLIAKPEEQHGPEGGHGHLLAHVASFSLDSPVPLGKTTYYYRVKFIFPIS